MTGHLICKSALSAARNTRNNDQAGLLLSSIQKLFDEITDFVVSSFVVLDCLPVEFTECLKWNEWFISNLVELEHSVVFHVFNVEVLVKFIIEEITAVLLIVLLVDVEVFESS